MQFVEFGCGCIGFRDFDTDQTIIVRDCERSPDDVQFYFSENHQHRLDSEILPAHTVEAWMRKIALLILDGKRLREIRRLINLDENNQPTKGK